MVALVLVPAGFVVGFLLAPLAAPFTGVMPWTRRTAMGVVAAAVSGVIGWRVGAHPVLGALLYIVAAGTLLAFVDVEVKRLPDRFTLPSYGVNPKVLLQPTDGDLQGTNFRLGFQVIRK